MKDKISWKGWNGNSSFDDLVETVFSVDYNSLRIPNTTTKSVFIQPYGKCIMIQNSNDVEIKERILIASQGQIQVLMDDSNIATSFRKMSMKSY